MCVCVCERERETLRHTSVGLETKGSVGTREGMCVCLCVCVCVCVCVCLSVCVCVLVLAVACLSSCYFNRSFCFRYLANAIGNEELLKRDTGLVSVSNLDPRWNEKLQVIKAILRLY